MRKLLPLRLGLFLILLINGITLGNSQAASAQGFGIGFGAGNWFGPGLWGSGGRYGGGGFYGMGANIAPGHYTTPVPEQNRLRSSLKDEVNHPSYGFLQGYVTLCAPKSATGNPVPGGNQAAPPAPATKLAGKCQPTQAGMDHVDVVASPYGLSQWIGTQPDKTGHYRLTLLPGGYLIQASDPEIQNQRPVEVIVQPGQTTRQNFQLGQ